MIYEYPEQDTPIRQGDIFIGIPRMEISLKRIAVVFSDRIEELNWEDISDNREPLTAILPIKSVIAIVLSQDCDALRAPDITLCEIRKFSDVELKSKDTTRVKKWVNILTQQARINQKWFYLPPDPKVGFEEKMGADFLVTLHVPREELEDFRHLRKGRLNDVAEAHFRERIAEFFRRYPYNEWYSLNDEEMIEYKERYPETKPYPWQPSSKTK